MYRRNNNGRKALPCAIPDTVLTSLILRPSTITCCDRFDRNCVNIDNTEPPIPTEQNLLRIPWWLTQLRLPEINLYDPSLLPTLQCTLQCMRQTQKCITGTQTFSISKPGGRNHTTAFHKSSEANRHPPLKHLRQYWMIWKKVGSWQQRRTVDPSEYGPGNYPDEQTAKTLP